MSSINQASRRDFIAGAAALAGAGVAGAAVAAGIPQPAVATETTPEPQPIEETYDCDVVVCGSGTAGLCGAWRAAELGAKVILVETHGEEGLGGNSRFVEGMSSGGCSYADGVLTLNEGPDIFDYGFTVISDYCHCACDLRLLRKFVTWMNPMLDWTHNVQGIDFLGLDIPLNNTMMAPPISYKPNEDHTIGGGRMAVYTMYEGCKNLGVEFLFDSRAIDLVMKDGAAAGVVCEHLDGSRMQVNAKAVMFATGGFSANGEMVEKYTHYSYESLIPYGTSGSQVGDAINMGLSVGAALHHPEALMFCSPVLPGHFNKSALVICGCNQADTCFFNEKGERFCNEECIKDWAESGNTGALQKHIFTVIDQDFVEKIHTEGPVTKRTNYFKANEPVPYFQEEIDEALLRENPRVVKADTLEELAEKLGMKDPQALVDNIAEWNSWCDEGKDHDFLKAPELMRKIQTPPFYGFKTILAFYTTVGGLKCDEFARVLDQSYEPIPGLYALGSDCAGLFGGMYDVAACPGSGQMWCRETGYWAGTHAVEEYLPTLG